MMVQEDCRLRQSQDVFAKALLQARRLALDDEATAGLVA